MGPSSCGAPTIHTSSALERFSAKHRVGLMQQNDTNYYLINHAPGEAAF